MNKNVCISVVRQLSIAALATLSCFHYANAAGTDAGTTVENTFVLSYDALGVPQPPITNDTDTPIQDAVIQGSKTLFTVDRLIDLNITEVNSPRIIAPGSTTADATLVFEVANTGNDIQSYSFSLQDGVDSNGAMANFDATAVTITYQIDDDGTPGFGPGDTQVTVPAIAPGTTSTTPAERTPDIAPDSTFRVLISGNIPNGLNDGAADEIILIAETRDPTNWIIEGATGSAGTVTAADTDGNELINVAENVFADGAGTIEDTANDGLFSEQGIFLIASPDLTTSKTVSVYDQAGQGCENLNLPAANPNGYAVPGACMEYIITIQNNGSIDAENISITDIIPDGVRFIAAGPDNISSALLFTPSAGANCTGGGCVVSVTNGTIPVGDTGRLLIRTLVIGQENDPPQAF